MTAPTQAELHERAIRTAIRARTTLVQGMCVRPDPRVGTPPDTHRRTPTARTAAPSPDNPESRSRPMVTIDKPHPEDTCERCGGRNPVWWVDSDRFNMGCNSGEIVCPTCFVFAHEEATGMHACWEMRPSTPFRWTSDQGRPTPFFGLVRDNDPGRVNDYAMFAEESATALATIDTVQWAPDALPALLSRRPHDIERPNPSGPRVDPTARGEVIEDVLAAFGLFAGVMILVALIALAMRAPW